MIVNARPATTDVIDEELVAASIPDATDVIWVTPEIAGFWLHRNTNNRPIRAARVTVMSRDMARDNWAFTGEAIKFSVSGLLVDGQHRLLAIIKAGTTIKMLVVVGVPDEAQAFMDSGARRTAADALAFRGETNSTTLAATSRFGATIELGRFSGRDNVSHADIIEWLTQNPEIRRYASQAQRYASKIDMKPSVMAYALWRMYTADKEEAEYFFTDLIEMRTEGPGDPIFTLLNRFHTARKNRERLSPLIELSFITRAWNARRAGQQLKLLKVPLNELEIVDFR